MISVLVVEDDPVVAEAHRSYVQRTPGFAVAGVVHDGRAALRFLRERPVDVVLLDFNLPDLHGLQVCRAIRAAGSAVDVIAVTSARDLSTVRSAVSQGIVQYLLKPFTFRSLRDKLERYQDYRQQVQGMIRLLQERYGLPARGEPHLKSEVRSEAEQVGFAW